MPASASLSSRPPTRRKGCCGYWPHSACCCRWGLGLNFDNQDVGRIGFARCLPNGCVAEVEMDDKLLGQLRTAKTAVFIIFQTPEEGIGFPLSLGGLGGGV